MIRLVSAARTMASRAFVDTELLRAAEATFADTDEVVVAAFYVLKLKQPGEHTGAELLKALAGKVRATPHPSPWHLLKHNLPREPRFTLPPFSGEGKNTKPGIG